MGLDVYLHKLDVKKTSDEYIEDVNQCYVFVIDEEWIDRISDLKSDKFYNIIESEDVVGYSYGTHGKFRQTLADVAYDGVPWIELCASSGHHEAFMEFINFADNEGCITWTTAKKLGKDFKQYESKYMEMFASDEYTYWRVIYKSWMDAFEKAGKKKMVLEYR
jgi:hypothetical protein